MKNTAANLLIVLSSLSLTAYAQQDSVLLSINEAKDLTRAYLVEPVYIRRLIAADSVIASQQKELIIKQGLIDSGNEKEKAYKNFDQAVEEFKKAKDAELSASKRSKKWWQAGFFSLLGFQVYKEIKEGLN